MAHSCPIGVCSMTRFPSLYTSSLPTPWIFKATSVFLLFSLSFHSFELPLELEMEIDSHPLVLNPQGKIVCPLPFSSELSKTAIPNRNCLYARINNENYRLIKIVNKSETNKSSHEDELTLESA